MKKILLATTLLASTAGFAAAEVAVTGTARMGVATALGGCESCVASDVQFTSRVRIIFTASGETDGGLTFGASVRNDQFGGNGNDGSNGSSGNSGTTNGDSTVYISGTFGKLTMGDTGNAADALVGQVSGVGFTSLGSMNEISWLGKNTTGALYEYSAGALTFAVGSGQINTGADFMSAAVKYSTDAYSVALGYEDSDGLTQTSISGSAALSGATVKAKLADNADMDHTAYALSVDYAVSGVGLTAYYTDHGYDNDTAFGLGASYDLGGGAAVKGGFAQKEDCDSIFDLGVTMSF